MDFGKLIYDAEKIESNLVVVGEKLVVKKPCKVYIPGSYEFRRLMTIGSKVNTLGIFLIVVEDKYQALFCAQAQVVLTPTASTKIKHADESVYEFYFEAGASLLDNTQFVKDDTKPYYIYNTYLDSGDVPFYVKYKHLLNIFKESKHYTGVTVGAHKGVIETVVATISRSKDDNMEQYRRVIKSYEDMDSNPPVYIPLSDPIYTASNTMAKLSGAYFDNGLVTALVKPTERVEAIEAVLLQQ
jgi:hypothetical protein